MSERANDELPPGCKRVKVAMADGTERIFRVEDLIPCDDPEPWTPKDGDPVRIVGEATVDDGAPEVGDSVSVDANGLLVDVPRSWLRPHADPTPDPRDAEIEQLHKEREAAMAEVSRLKAELAAKPAAAPLSPDERDRLAQRVRERLTGQPGESW